LIPLTGEKPSPFRSSQYFTLVVLDNTGRLLFPRFYVFENGREPSLLSPPLMLAPGPFSSPALQTREPLPFSVVSIPEGLSAITFSAAWTFPFLCTLQAGPFPLFRIEVGRWVIQILDFFKGRLGPFFPPPFPPPFGSNPTTAGRLSFFFFSPAMTGKRTSREVHLSL